MENRCARIYYIVRMCYNNNMCVYRMGLNDLKDEIYECECTVDYSEKGISGSPTSCHYHGSGVWQCPECGELRDFSDRTHLLTLEYFKEGDDADYATPEDNIHVRAIDFEDRLNDGTRDSNGLPVGVKSIMDDIRDGGGWAYEGIGGHELGFFKTEVYWYWYRCSYEYQEYELDMMIITEDKLDEAYLKLRLSNIEPGDLVLYSENEDTWFNFKCRDEVKRVLCPFIQDGERADCVSVSPRGTFQYCPSLVIVVSEDTVKNHMSKSKELK